jgi:hypothetical protein
MVIIREGRDGKNTAVSSEAVGERRDGDGAVIWRLGIAWCMGMGMGMYMCKSNFVELGKAVARREGSEGFGIGIVYVCVFWGRRGWRMVGVGVRARLGCSPLIWPERCLGVCRGSSGCL